MNSLVITFKLFSYFLLVFSSEAIAAPKATMDTVLKQDLITYSSQHHEVIEFPKRSYDVHLADSYQGGYPSIEEMAAMPLPQPGMIQGKIRYAGVISKGYRYDVLVERNRVVIEVRIHFQEASDYDLYLFNYKINKASKYWTQNLPKDLVPFPVEFRFLIADSAQQAHYSVRLKDVTRGPYDKQWGRGFSENDVAHEIGHMMGLGDEYNLLKTSPEKAIEKCHVNSIMCHSSIGKPHFRHYYFILRRLYSL